MTSTVIVRAHCSNDKQVKVILSDKGGPIETHILQDGESIERCVFDNREISVFEELKNG